MESLTTWIFFFFALHSIFEPHLVPSFLSSSQTSSPDPLWGSCIYLLTRLSVDSLFPPEFTVQTTTKSSPSNGKLYLKLFSSSVFKWPEKCLPLKFCMKKKFCMTIDYNGDGNGNPLQYSCLENPTDRGAWWAAVHGVTQSRTRLKQLSILACIDYKSHKILTMTLSGW